MFFLDENINKRNKLEAADPSVVYVPLNAGRTVGANSRSNVGSFNAERPAGQIEVGEWVQNRLNDASITLASVISIVGDDSGPYTETLVPTAAHTIYLVDVAAGAATLTLPPVASSAGKFITVKKVDDQAVAITLDGNASETIDGAATNATLDAEFDVMTIYCDGSAWYIISSVIA